MASPRAAIILAAGQGTRMKSALPKVLHKVGGQAMLDWALAASGAIGCDPRVVIVGAQLPQVGEHAHRAIPAHHVVVQDPPLGTGHAVRCAEAALAGFTGDIAILFGDTPLIRPETIERMFAARAAGASIVLLAFEAADPTGYGRLLRDEAGDLARIVEHKDATEAERTVTLCNSGVMVADAAILFQLLAMVRNDNAKGEYYLTDVVGLARSAGRRAAFVVGEESEVLGVNSRVELAAAERHFQSRRRSAALLDGVTMIDPETVYFSHDTLIEPDVSIEPGVFFGPGVVVRSGATVRAYSHIEGAEIGPGASVGPFVRLRPGARLAAGVKLGNFVEVKNARFGEQAQASHLSYIGDAEIGARANLGAGTITCNYDGFDKHRTTIGADAFIGSDTSLVAPVSVGARAITGSGSVITGDVPEGALAVARERQRDIPGWADAFRERKRAAKNETKS